jgi:hypothetical protein
MLNTIKLFMSTPRQRIWWKNSLGHTKLSHDSIRIVINNNQKMNECYPRHLNIHISEHHRWKTSYNAVIWTPINVTVYNAIKHISRNTQIDMIWRINKSMLTRPVPPIWLTKIQIRLTPSSKWLDWFQPTDIEPCPSLHLKENHRPGNHFRTIPNNNR